MRPHQAQSDVTSSYPYRAESHDPIGSKSLGQYHHHQQQQPQEQPPNGDKMEKYDSSRGGLRNDLMSSTAMTQAIAAQGSVNPVDADLVIDASSHSYQYSAGGPPAGSTPSAINDSRMQSELNRNESSSTRFDRLEVNDSNPGAMQQQSRHQMSNSRTNISFATVSRSTGGWEDSPVSSSTGVEARISIRKEETLEEKKSRQRIAFQTRAMKRKLELFDKALLYVQQFEETLAYPSWTVEPSIVFPTRFGQEIYLIGDCPQLGQWDTKLSIPMKWAQGGIWSTVIHIPGRIASIEYKYLLVEAACGGLANPQWEWGANHKISCAPYKNPHETKRTNSDLFPPRIWISERDYWGGGEG